MTKCTVTLAATYPPLQDSKSLTSLATSIKTICELQVTGTSDKLLHERLVTPSCACSQEIQLKIKLHVKLPNSYKIALGWNKMSLVEDTQVEHWTICCALGYGEIYKPFL